MSYVSFSTKFNGVLTGINVVMVVVDLYIGAPGAVVGIPCFFAGACGLLTYLCYLVDNA